MNIFLNNWENKEDLINDFKMDSSELDSFDVLLASYSHEDYSGNAFVLLQDKNTKKLFEVHGSHCSCSGLECQWFLEETNKDSLEHRAKNGNAGFYYGVDEYSAELREVLKGLST